MGAGQEWKTRKGECIMKIIRFYTPKGPFVALLDPLAPFCDCNRAVKYVELRISSTCNESL